jgi:type III secretion protein U
MSSDKTEEPTHKKLADARKKGDVAKSKELAATASLISVLALLIAIFPYLMKTARDDLFASFDAVARGGDAGEISKLLAGAAKTLVFCTLPVLAVGFFMEVVGNVAQVGLMLSFEALAIKPDKFNPAANLKNMFAPAALFEFMMGFIKLIVLGYLFYFVMSGYLGTLVGSLYIGPSAIIPVLSVLLRKTIMNFCAAFIILALIDFLFRKKQYTKKHMMSKQEVKQEYKESEGDPLIKHKRRALQEEIIEQAIIESTRKATVVIVNPTHYAVAIFYDDKSGTLPLVVGKGEGRLALRMMKAAEEEQIPLLRDVPLARGLYAESVVDHQIPISFIKPVAETLKWVRKLKRGNGP